MNSEHVFTGKWTEALGLMALPTNAPSSLKLLAYLVDDMWHHAGGTSPDVRLNYKGLHDKRVSPHSADYSFHGTPKELCWLPFTSPQS